MRLIVALAAAAGAVACASIGAPPGGPERLIPPALIAVTPDSGALNVRDRSVVFEFDVVVNDRSGGAAGLENLFLVSPSEGPPRVRWRRERLEVRARGDFRDNTAYSVTMLPGISDLRGNVMTTGRTVIFSTGPAIPPFAVLGRVFDWPAERIAPGAFVEVYRLSDSLRYLGSADSTGQFTVGPLEEGAYTVRGVIDNNRNRAADPGELWDSVVVTVRGTSPFVELLAAPRDTIAPRLLTVTAQDTATLLASFDRALDPSVPLTPASFRIETADSVRLRIARVLTRMQETAERAARDTAAAPDTGQARRDSVPPRAIPVPTAPAATQIKPSRPAPPRDVVIRLDSSNTLTPGASYRVTAVNAVGLLGTTRTSDRVFVVPQPRRDTTAARPPVDPPADPPPNPPVSPPVNPPMIRP